MYQVEGQGKGPCVPVGHAISSSQILMGRCTLGQRCYEFRGNLHVSQGSYGSDIHENLKKKVLAPRVLLTDRDTDVIKGYLSVFFELDLDAAKNFL